MTDFLRRHGLMFSAVALFACSLQLMSISVRDPSMARLGGKLFNSVLFPAEKLYHEMSESVKYVWSHYLWLLQVETERNQFRERVKELESHNSHLVEYQQENTRLRSLLEFGEATGYNGVAASVVGRDPSNWMKTVTIDRGANSGIRSGLAVVDGKAVVGQTTVVTRNSAKVLLLVDNSSAIDAIVQTSRATGILEGTGGGRLRLRYVEYVDEHPVRVGDRVIASGLDGVFPKGTLLGVVHRVNRSGSAMFQEIEVEPSVDVNRLENVQVLLPEKIENPGSLTDLIKRQDGQDQLTLGRPEYQCAKSVGGRP